MDRSSTKRFMVALSFPGERREFVDEVAGALAEILGRKAIFYDRFFQAEFARPDLDTYLQKIYWDESELIAIFLTSEYEAKEWVGLEWRAIRDLIQQRRDTDILLLRFGDAEIPGLLSIDGSVDIGTREPREVAELILRRLGDTDERKRDRLLQPERPRRGPFRLPSGAAHLIGRHEELARLDEAWNDPRTHVLTLVAWGGVGKTSLVSNWVATLAARGFDRAHYFDWSFYSQGTRDKGGPSADAFVASALRFFGDTTMADSTAAPQDKGARLAELVAKERTLLVLDGLEPLQHPPGPLAGTLQDPAMSALLKGLAAQNPGLCVVTTRVRVGDLSPFERTTAPTWSLQRLSSPAGVELLERLGVHGPRREVEQLVEDVHGHALTLNLLGGYLARAHGGDVRRRDRIELEEADISVQGGHAFKTMDAYSTWLAHGGDDGAPQLAVLRLLGLFDRPADKSRLDVLRSAPPIAGLTESLVGLTDEEWALVSQDLSDSRLVVRGSPGDATLDAHPLVREYFAARLRSEAPEAWRLAHRRLFVHLQETTEHRPETLEGLAPLYQAIRHGCEAGRHQEACTQVYFERILRGPEFYSTRQLGAVGADLGAVSNFFDRPWSGLSPKLSKSDQAWLFGEVATRLRALGRLDEALEPMRTGIRLAVEQEDWANAAIYESNLSDLELTLGDLSSAVDRGKESVQLADRSSEPFLQTSSRAAYAEALHQSGRRDEALALFREAEALQVSNQPSYPFLYSLAGFRFCDALLADAERAAWWTGLLGVATEGSAASRPGLGNPDDLVSICHEVQRRTAETLSWVEAHRTSLLDLALNHLTLGCAGLYRAILEPSERLVPGSIREAHEEIERASDGLRHSGQQPFLPRVLLARAFVRALGGDPDGARADLDEAHWIAEVGPMPLVLADAHLCRARLFRDREALSEARRLVDKHGYQRRFGELADAEEMTKHW